MRTLPGGAPGCLPRHTERVQAILRTTDEPLGETGCQGFAGDAVAGRPDRVADAAPAPAFP